ncbi:DNA polymerase I [compost metagenome]
MLLQVHDELAFEVKNSELEIMRALIRDKMENVLAGSIPLQVEIGEGENWGEAHG